MITGYFNAKLGKQASMEAIGAHARGTRYKNGEYLQHFLCKNKLIAPNTFFKHRACHITTWEGWITINIDYILLRISRKQSIPNARSYNVFRVESDHRLVITTLRRAKIQNIQRAK